MADNTMGVVWNPAKADRNELEAALEAAGAVAGVRWFETSEDDPGQQVAREALTAGCSPLLVAGGDGTVRAVAEALAGSGVPMAIAPSGTGNLLARNLDLPLDDLEAACRIAVSGTDRAIDLGWAETTSDAGSERNAFAVMAGFGIDSRMIAETDDDLKSKVGWLAYVAALGKALSSADVVEFSLARDDGPVEELSAHTVMIGNCGTLQGGINLLPAAEPDDGKLDLLVLSADSIGQWLDTMKTMFWDNGLLRLLRRDDGARDGQTTTHLTGERIRLTVGKPVTFEVDGDTVEAVTEADIHITAGALLVRVAAPDAAANV